MRKQSVCVRRERNTSRKRRLRDSRGKRYRVFFSFPLHFIVWSLNVFIRDLNTLFTSVASRGDHETHTPFRSGTETHTLVLVKDLLLMPLVQRDV